MGVLLGVLVYALFRWRVYQPAWKGREWGFFIFFLILIAITSLFIGLRLSSASARPLPGLPADAPGSALMIFSAIPWLLGGGLLGPVGAAVLGAFAGLLRGTWDTYSLFSILELALMGAWFSMNMRQRYRTPAYALLRQPLVGALLLIPFHVLFYIDQCVVHTMGRGYIRASHCASGFCIEQCRCCHACLWRRDAGGGHCGADRFHGISCDVGRQTTLAALTGEKSLESRFLFAVGTFISLLLLTLLIGDWVVAGRAAREMLRRPPFQRG